MSSSNAHSDTSGRVLGTVVFLLGIALLCLVFGIAWSLFRAPVPGLELPIKTGATPPAASGIGIALSAFVRQLLLLAVMTFAGSLIAGKGIQLYFTAHGVPHTEAPLSVGRNGHTAESTDPAPESSSKKSA